MPVNGRKVKKYERGCGSMLPTPERRAMVRSAVTGRVSVPDGGLLRDRASRGDVEIE